MTTEQFIEARDKIVELVRPMTEEEREQVKNVIEDRLDLCVYCWGSRPCSCRRYD